MHLEKLQICSHFAIVALCGFTTWKAFSWKLKISPDVLLDSLNKFYFLTIISIKYSKSGHFEVFSDDEIELTGW